MAIISKNTDCYCHFFPMVECVCVWGGGGGGGEEEGEKCDLNVFLN